MRHWGVDGGELCARTVVDKDKRAKHQGRDEHCGRDGVVGMKG